MGILTKAKSAATAADDTVEPYGSLWTDPTFAQRRVAAAEDAAYQVLRHLTREEVAKVGDNAAKRRSLANDAIVVAATRLLRQF